MLFNHIHNLMFILFVSLCKRDNNQDIEVLDTGVSNNINNNNPDPQY